VTALEAWDDVRLQLPNTPDGVQQEIRAGRLSPDGPPGAEMTAVRFEQNVEYRELGTATDTGAEMSRVIRAERLEARVEEGLSALVEARFLGDVLFEDGTTRRMLADEAVYDVLGGLVRLSAGGDAGRAVTLSDAGSDGDDTIDVIADVLTISLIRMVAPPLPVEAAPEPAPIPESIEPAPVVPRAYAITLAGHEVSLDGSTLEASGNVTSVLTPRGDDTPESVSGKMPSLLDDDREVLVSADAIRYDGNAGQATYTGQAHLWQGATSFWGDTLTLDDRTGNLIARGNVRTSIQLVRLNETTQRREVSLTYAEADTFVYDEAAKHAVYETTARLRSEHVDLKADTIEVFLETDGRTLDKLQATGDVKLRLDGRWATGESLVYYEAEGRYEMEGAPVEIVEEVEPVETTTTAPPPPGAIPPPPSCSSSTGLTLTFYRSTDTVTVDGQEERRTEINSGKCTPLTF
jgi:lipopolysaccharide export system protein LptA